MRRHGWGGDLPADDDEAVARILDAARELLEEHPGTVPTISDVAARISVTRQTVYRYFPGVQALLVASVHGGVEDFLDATAAHLAGITSPAEAVVECLAFVHEEMGRRRDIVLVLAAGMTSPGEFLSDMARELGRLMLDRLSVDWAALGFTDSDLNGLVEMMLRTLMSFAYTPGTPQRSPEEFRAYLRRWVGPAILPTSS